MIKEEFIKIVGLKNVIDSESILDSYQSDMSFTDPQKPVFVVKPQRVDDIKLIVSLANNTSTPLIPVSSGTPRFRGDTVPRRDGAIIVDLSGLKNIINIDRDYRVAMFEPGITYGELIEAVKKQGLRLNMPLLPKQSKSVVASVLEREPVTMPTYHWDIADPLNCVEVIWGSGELFRTGGAAGPGSIEEQWEAGQAQNEAAGPTQASWHRIIQGAQGTLGIVTWASLRCEIIPKLERPFLIGSQNLNQIIDLVHWLIRLRLVNECFILSNTSLPLLLPWKSETEYQKTTSSLPAWVLFFNIAGYNYLPEERISYMVKEMEKLANQSGLKPDIKIGLVEADDILTAVKNPSEEPYWKLRPRGAFEEIAFITKYTKINELTDIVYAVARTAGITSSNLGTYIQPIVQGVNCHCEYNLFYDPLNAKEVAVVKKLAADVIPLLIDKGAFFSRPYQNTKLIYDRDVTTVEMLKKVKTMFDPNNIMNPGKLCFQ